MREKQEILESVQSREERPLQMQVAVLRQERREWEGRLREMERGSVTAAVSPVRSITSSIEVKSPPRSVGASLDSRHNSISKQDAIQALSQLLLSRAAYARAQK